LQRRAAREQIPERANPGRTDFTLRNTPKVVGDIRESPALKILTLLSALGADLRYHATRTYRRSPTTASQASPWRRHCKTQTSR
jgi:UDP-N-acetyl-D-mannosaminuronate dehydrogenase